jgi:hypothetical protein
VNFNLHLMLMQIPMEMVHKLIVKQACWLVQTLWEFQLKKSHYLLLSLLEFNYYCSFCQMEKTNQRLQTKSESIQYFNVYTSLISHSLTHSCIWTPKFLWIYFMKLNEKVWIVLNYFIIIVQYI